MACKHAVSDRIQGVKSFVAPGNRGSICALFTPLQELIAAQVLQSFHGTPLIHRSKSCGDTLPDASVVSLSHLVRLLGFQASKVQVWQQGTLYSFRLRKIFKVCPALPLKRAWLELCMVWNPTATPLLPPPPPRRGTALQSQVPSQVSCLPWAGSGKTSTNEPQRFPESSLAFRKPKKYMLHEELAFLRVVSRLYRRNVQKASRRATLQARVFFHSSSPIYRGVPCESASSVGVD